MSIIPLNRIYIQYEIYLTLNDLLFYNGYFHELVFNLLVKEIPAVIGNLVTNIQNN